jgi:hypothetical protein
MTSQLVGKRVGGWLIQQYINNGKSAVVFLAERDGRQAALKVFDPVVVARFGRDAQRERISRERSLIGKNHPNLVQVSDGGEDGDLLFISMEFFGGKNVADALQQIPASEVRSLISQVAAAARFLEDSSFAHRDIKPENIGVAPDYTTVKLLDLGVIKPLDLSGFTDVGDQHHFVGTLQYSPPEFMYREEKHSLESWRAITFYQLGGVLHDLLVRKPLFGDFTTPYTRLVRAVEHAIPRIDAADIDPGLRLLAETCLLKSPQQRLDAVKWDDFSWPQVEDPLEAARRRIAKHGATAAAAARAPEVAPRVADLLRKQLYDMRTSIHSAVVNTCKTEILPRYVTKTITEEPYILRTLFEPSARDGLVQHFALYCTGSVLDPTTCVHELRLSACISPDRNMVPAEPPKSAPLDLTRGPLIDQDIRQRVQRYLVLAYAEALDAGSPGTTAVQWLSVGAKQ